MFAAEGLNGLNVGSFLDGTVDLYTRFKELELQRDVVDLKAEQARLDLARVAQDQRNQFSTPQKTQQVNQTPETGVPMNTQIGGVSVNTYLLGGAAVFGVLALALALKG